MTIAQAGMLTFLGNAFATFFFTAVIWYTQILGYPLWRWVGDCEFHALHSEYLRRLPAVVQVPYAFLLASNLLLYHWRPAAVSMGMVSVLLFLNVSVLAVSVALAGPIHTHFQDAGKCPPAKMQKLLAYNAVRMLLMVASSGVVSYVLFKMLITHGK